MQTFMKGVFIRGYEDKNACNESVQYTPIILFLHIKYNLQPLTLGIPYTEGRFRYTVYTYTQMIWQVTVMDIIGSNNWNKEVTIFDYIY